MRVSIAGSGAVARYLSEELPAAGIDVVILTRSIKPHFSNRPGVEQVVTDYSSVDALAQAIEGSEALISTILDDKPSFIDVHLRLIEAARRTKTCKRFVPAEYGGDTEKYPDQPGFYSRLQGPVRQALREQNDLEWTIVSCGWLVDLALPRRNRYFNDPGPVFPIDHNTREVVIPGTGDEPLDLTATRDMARAMARLLRAPKWEQHTYMTGEKTTNNAMVAQILEKYPGMSVEHRSLYQLVQDIRNAKSEEAAIVAEYRMFVISNAGSLPADKVAAHRESMFADVHFRTIRELLEELEQNPDIVP